MRRVLIDSERNLMGIAEGIDAEKALSTMADRLADLEAGRPVHGLHGWEVDMPPDSGPWTLTSDDELVLEATA